MLFRSTGLSSKQGLITYPLVEVLIPAPEMCNACASCGTFESHKEGDEEPVRFKRCARCKQVSVRSSMLLFCFQAAADSFPVLQSLRELFPRRSAFLADHCASSVKGGTGKQLIDPCVSTCLKTTTSPSRKQGERA